LDTRLAALIQIASHIIGRKATHGRIVLEFPISPLAVFALLASMGIHDAQALPQTHRDELGRGVRRLSVPCQPFLDALATSGIHIRMEDDDEHPGSAPLTPFILPGGLRVRASSPLALVPAGVRVHPLRYRD